MDKDQVNLLELDDQTLDRMEMEEFKRNNKNKKLIISSVWGECYQ